MVAQARAAAEFKDQMAARKAAEDELIRQQEIKKREAEREAAQKAFAEQTRKIAEQQAYEVELRR